MTEWILTSSLLILIVIGLRAILKGRISLRLQYGLWLLVLVRLLLPLSLPSQWSILNLFPGEAPEALAQPITYVAYDPQSLPDLARPEIDYALPESEQQPQYEQALQEYEQTINEAKAETGIAVTWEGILYTVWIVGMVAMAATLVVCNLRFDRKLKATAKSAVTMGCHLPTYFSDAVATPCLFGLFRPRIYLTAEAASRMDVMQYVLTHELAHYQHKDHIWSVLRCVCLVLHWYNPLVWVAAILSKQDAELCCDETAIKFLGEHQRQSYGRALIDMSCVKKDVKSLFVTATTMIGSKKALKERILLIAKHPKTALYTLILVILVAAIAVGCTFTGHQPDTTDPSSDSTEPSNGTSEPSEESTGLTPTGYPDDEVQFTLAYINGQPYIHDSTWNPGSPIPFGYLRDGSIETEDNKHIPDTERSACHIAPGTPIYTNKEDDTYVFYWSIPQEENFPRRMIRLDQTSFVLDDLRSTLTDTVPTYPSGEMPFSLIRVNGKLYGGYAYDSADHQVEVIPSDAVLLGEILYEDNAIIPYANFQACHIPVGYRVVGYRDNDEMIYLSAGPWAWEAEYYCLPKVDLTNFLPLGQYICTPTLSYMGHIYEADYSGTVSDHIPNDSYTWRDSIITVDHTKLPSRGRSAAGLPSGAKIFTSEESAVIYVVSESGICVPMTITNTVQPTVNSTQPSTQSPEAARYQALFSDSASLSRLGLYCTYEDPSQIDLSLIFYNQLEARRELFDAEVAHLKSAGFELMMDVQVHTALFMENTVQELFGIGIYDLPQSAFGDLLFWGDTGCYYSNHNDAYGVRIHVTDVTVLEDGCTQMTYELTSHWQTPPPVYVATFKEHPDGRVQFYSNLPQ